MTATAIKNSEEVLSEEEVRASLPEGLTLSQAAAIWGRGERSASARCRTHIKRFQKRRVHNFAITWNEFDHVMESSNTAQIVRWLTEDELYPSEYDIVDCDIPNHIRMVVTRRGHVDWVCRVGYNGMESDFKPSVPRRYKTKAEARAAIPVIVDEYQEWFDGLQNAEPDGFGDNARDDEEAGPLELAQEMLFGGDPSDGEFRAASVYALVSIAESLDRIANRNEGEVR